MQSYKRKRFVYTGNNQNQEGITYLSVLFALSILLLILPFTGFIHQSTNSKSYQEGLAVEQGFRFIQDEIEQSVKVTVTPDTLEFLYPDNTISSISLYQDLLRRQVFGQGHEILLRGVQTIIFTSEPYGLNIKVETVSGNSYEKKVFILGA